MYNLSDAALYSTLEANINKVIKLKVNENSSDHPPPLIRDHSYRF